MVAPCFFKVVYTHVFMCYKDTVRASKCQALFLKKRKKSLDFLSVSVILEPVEKGARVLMGEYDGLNFRRGFLQLVILSLLTQREMFGLEIVEEAEKQSNGRFCTQVGSLYPVLYKLLEHGYICSREVPSYRYMKRVYYRITPKGEEYLRSIKKDFNKVIGGVMLILEREGGENEGDK